MNFQRPAYVISDEEEKAGQAEHKLPCREYKAEIEFDKRQEKQRMKDDADKNDKRSPVDKDIEVHSLAKPWLEDADNGMYPEKQKSCDTKDRKDFRRHFVYYIGYESRTKWTQLFLTGD